MHWFGSLPTSVTESCLSITEDPAQLRHHYFKAFLPYMAHLLRLVDGMELHPYIYMDNTQSYGSCTPDASSAIQQRISTFVIRTLEWMQATVCS